MLQKYTLSHKNFAKIHCFKRTLKISFHMIPCRIIFSSIVIPCRVIFIRRGHPVAYFSVKEHHAEQHIPSSQVWEYPPPGLQRNLGDSCSLIFQQTSYLRYPCFSSLWSSTPNIIEHINNINIRIHMI